MRAGFTALILALAMLTGCGRDFSTSNMARYHDAGMRAEQNRDYQTAEEQYERALVWAGTEKVPPSMLSLSMYNLGRMKGHSCKFTEARELLLTSLALEEQTSGPDSPQITRRLFELARLYYDRRQYAEAQPYYAQAIAMLRRLGLEGEDPVNAGDALREYATVLRQSGNSRAAVGAIAEADALRARYPDETRRFTIARYTAACRGTAAAQRGRA